MGERGTGWNVACKLFDKSLLLEFNVHLHLQYFSFLCFIVGELFSALLFAFSSSQSYRRNSRVLVLRNNMLKQFLHILSPPPPHSLPAICQVSFFYLRWHKFMMIFHVANQKSTQNLFTWHVARETEQETKRETRYVCAHSLSTRRDWQSATSSVSFIVSISTIFKTLNNSLCAWTWCV